MKDQEYITLLEELFNDALDEITKLKKIIQIQKDIVNTQEQTNQLSGKLTLACLERQRESLFVSQN